MSSLLIGEPLSPSYARLARLASSKTSEEFDAYLAQIGVDLGFDGHMCAGSDAPLQQSYSLDDRPIGNRFCILPMEGWDGTLDGMPSELTLRRWINFGESGAKLIWGGEAVAVRHNGRGNPNQLLLDEHTLCSFERLRRELVAAHEARFGSSADLLVGLQLTYSGRFSRPNQKGVPEPRFLYHHPLLDARWASARMTVLCPTATQNC